jgi:hypothetical protein
MTARLLLPLLALLLAAPASAATRLELLSTTRFQLRQDFDGAVRAPLYEDVMASVRVGLPNRADFSGLAMMKLGTTLGATGGDVDLYLLKGTVHWRRLRLELTGGRMLLLTPAGLRVVDGVHLEGRPIKTLRLTADVGWLRDTERDDLNGGALVLQGGLSVHAVPGANAGAEISMRVGPETTPRLDARVTADALIKAPLTPRPWITASFRVDTGEVRRVHGGVQFHPIGPVGFELLGRLDNVVDRDGTMAELLLAAMTDSPVGGGGVGLRVRSPVGAVVSANYLLTGYRVSEALTTVGHSVDARVAWGKETASLYVDCMMRWSYGGTFTAVGLGGRWSPHPLFDLHARAQVAPFEKGSKPLSVAAWAFAEASFRPVAPLEITLGGEYRSTVLLEHDLRLNARLVVHLVAWRKPA